LVKCRLLVCWKNDLERKTIVKDGKPFLNVRGHEIEVMALNKIVDELRKKGRLDFPAQSLICRFLNKKCICRILKKAVTTRSHF